MIDDNFFFIFFFIFFFFFLILLLYFRDYTYREIVPGLTDTNYQVVNTAINIGNDLNNLQFVDLQIQDGATGTQGIDFNTDAGNITAIAFIPTYMDSSRVLRGYFKLYVTLGITTNKNIVFRVVDSDSIGGNTLPDYNIGWNSINLTTRDQLREVIVPFKTNDLKKLGIQHRLSLQVGSTNGNLGNLEINNVSVYYY